jgi:hypothetical protein
VARADEFDEQQAWHDPFTLLSSMQRILAIAAAASLTLAVAAGCQRDAAPADTATDGRSSAGRGATDCGIPPGDVQVEEGVGVLRIGTSAEEVRRRCSVVRDTTVLDNEGMPARRLVVSIGDDTAVAEIVADSVWRVRFTSPRFRAGGLGIGTSGSALAAIPGARALVGEGEVYVTIPGACGVSYRVAGADFGRVSGARSPEEAMDLLPDTAQVDLMLVYACANAPAA